MANRWRKAQRNGNRQARIKEAADGRWLVQFGGLDGAWYWGVRQECSSYFEAAQEVRAWINGGAV